MKSLEDELRSLLQREEPPEGFSARVSERLAGAGNSEVRPGRLRGALSLPLRVRWAMAGAALCVVLGVAYAGYREREARRGEIARAQAIQALRIADTKLNAALHRALLNGRGHLPAAE